MLIALNKIAADIGVESFGDSSSVVISSTSVVAGVYFGTVLSAGDGFIIGIGIISVVGAIGLA